jgi:MATE family multidrug resistance protein
MSHKAKPLKTLLTFSAPVIAGYLGQITMGIVDTAVVGRLGAAPLGGVSLGNAMFYVWMVLGFGMLTGMDFPASHAYGSGNPGHARRIFLNALFLAAVMSVPLTIVPFCLSFCLHWFGSSPEVVQQTTLYLQILSLTMGPILIFTVCRQYLQILGKPRAAFWILIIANAINLVANLAFVLGWWGAPTFGAAGSAMATCIARVTMALIGVASVLWIDGSLRNRHTWRDFRISGSICREIMKLGTPAGLQMLLEVGAFSGSSALVSRLGAVDLAVHQIVLQAASFSFMVPLGLSSAAAVLVGSSLGSKNLVAARRYGNLGFMLGTGFMASSGIVMWLFPGLIIGFFTPDPAVLKAATSVLFVAAAFQIFDGLQVVGTGVLRGVADTRTPLIANALGHWAVGIPLGAWLCFRGGMGLTGLWVGLAAGLAFVGVVLLVAWAHNARQLAAGRIPPAAAAAIARGLLNPTSS